MSKQSSVNQIPAKKTDNGVWISIIVPCYNVESYLPRCVDSILNQTLGQDKMEIILVDDCSSDGTKEVIHRYEEKYACIKAIYNPENLCLGGARNRGIDAASGKYIGFVDSDDWIEPEMFRAMCKAAEAHEAEVVSALSVRDREYRFLTEGEIATGVPDRLISIESALQRREMMASGRVKIGAWNCIFLRELINGNRIRFPEHLFYEDIYWGSLVRLSVRKIVQLERNYYHYFVRENSIVLRKDNNRHYDFFAMQNLLWEELKHRGAFEQYGKELEFDYLINYYIGAMKILALRYSDFPIDAFYAMQKDIHTKLPDWQLNPYLKTNTTEFQKLQFGLLGAELTEEEVKQLAEITRQYYGG